MFDYRRRVVTIRQRKPLYQIEKMWADRPIAIEDPFDLNHNLGSGLSLRSNTSHWRILGWKLSPVVFYHWLTLLNTTWLSFQPNWKLSPVVFYHWFRLLNTTWLSFQPNWKLSPVVFYHWFRLLNTTWLSFQPNTTNSLIYYLILKIIQFVVGAHIRRVFVSARRLFQTPVHEVPRHFKSLEVLSILITNLLIQWFIHYLFQAYLFDTRKLAPFGPPPNDRGCLICSKVGHKAKKCEYRRNKKRAPRVKLSPRRNKRVRLPSLNVQS